MTQSLDVYGPITQAERCLDVWLREENRMLPQKSRGRAAALLARYFQHEEDVNDQLMLSFLRHYSGFSDVDLDDIQNVKAELKTVLDKSIVQIGATGRGGRYNKQYVATKGFSLITMIACFFFAWHFFQSPITPDQQQALRLMVDKVALEKGIAHTSVWAEVKKPMGVTRYQDIRRIDFNEVQNILRRKTQKDL